VKTLVENVKLDISCKPGSANFAITCVKPAPSIQIIALLAYPGLIYWIVLVNSLAKNIASLVMTHAAYVKMATLVKMEFVRLVTVRVKLVRTKLFFAPVAETGFI
jgi:hypothetical protein